MLAEFNFLGRLSSDPIYKVLPNGTKLCELTVATEEYVGAGNKNVSYFTAEAYKERAEAIEKFLLRKGDTVWLQGNMKNDHWTDSSGKVKYKTKFKINNWRLIHRKAEPVDDKQNSFNRERAEPADNIEFVDPEDDLPF